MKQKRIPETDSIRELAEFWDTHDVTDFNGDLEEVKERVFEKKQERVVQVRLRPSEAAAVKRLARSKGMASGDLIQEWVRKRVARDAEQKRRADARKDTRGSR